MRLLQANGIVVDVRCGYFLVVLNLYKIKLYKFTKEFNGGFGGFCEHDEWCDDGHLPYSPYVHDGCYVRDGYDDDVHQPYQLQTEHLCWAPFQIHVQGQYLIPKYH